MKKAPPGFAGRGLLGSVLPAQAERLPSRFRATSTAAAAPKRRIIGGAGTGVPPVEPLDEPPDEELLELDEELLDEEEEELDEPLELPEEPKLLDPLAPELVEAPVLVEVDEVDPPWLDDPELP